MFNVSKNLLSTMLLVLDIFISFSTTLVLTMKSICLPAGALVKCLCILLTEVYRTLSNIYNRAFLQKQLTTYGWAFWALSNIRKVLFWLAKTKLGNINLWVICNKNARTWALFLPAIDWKLSLWRNNMMKNRRSNGWMKNGTMDFDK